MNPTARPQIARMIDRGLLKFLNLSFDRLMCFGCTVIHRFEKSEAVSLTFDDGPTSHTTRKILSALEQYNAKATFYCVGSNALAHPDIIREINSLGHDVANHTQTHPDLHTVLPRRLLNEVVACNQTLRNIINEPIISFRAPFGHFRADLRFMPYFSSERALIHWDVSPSHFEMDPLIMSDYIISRVRPGSIILLHDGLYNLDHEISEAVGRATVECLHFIIPNILERGLKLHTIAQQLVAIDCRDFRHTLSPNHKR